MSGLVAAFTELCTALGTFVIALSGLAIICRCNQIAGVLFTFAVAIISLGIVGSVFLVSLNPLLLALIALALLLLLVETVRSLARRWKQR